MIHAADSARFAFGLLARLARAHRAPPAWPRPVDRARAFLDRLDAILSLPSHAYGRMLSLCGWPRDRVAGSLARIGLMPTLAALQKDGVCLSADEAKGRVALVRAGVAIPFAPASLDCAAGPSVPLSTSGSSGPGTRNPLDLAGFELQASYMRAMLDAFGALSRPLALYYPAPSAPGIAHLLSFALAGHPPAAWFCHLPERESGRRAWSLRMRALSACARVLGVPLARPQLAPVESPSMLVDWLVEHGPERPVLASFPGSALRLVAHAEAIGRPLPPTTFILGGEPVSRLKRESLEARGHAVYPWYGAVDAGRIAIGCLAPECSDDMHLLTDRFAAITVDDRLLLTSLDAAVHKRFINTDFGDLARLSQRRCGCPLELPGFDVHIGHVRSVQKLCLEGITLPADVVHSLAEERLPAACGGAPDDYQLVEEEAEDGLTRLVVRVAPGLPVDESVVIATVERVVLEAVGGARAEAERLRRAGVIVVRRERPQFSRSGKLLAGRLA
jgi:hypothetical protein